LNGHAAFEAIIHAELRVLRQKIQQDGVTPSTILSCRARTLRYQRFADRSAATKLTSAVRWILPSLFQGPPNPMDIGCGTRARCSNSQANTAYRRGIDLSADTSPTAEQRLAAEQADLFPTSTRFPIPARTSSSSSQVVEHSTRAAAGDDSPLRVEAFRRGGVLALETPNPMPRHLRDALLYRPHDVPPSQRLARFYMEECGLGSIKIRRLSPAVEASRKSRPAADFAAKFSHLDYAILAGSSKP